MKTSGKRKRYSWCEPQFKVGQKVKLYPHFCRKLPGSGVVERLRKNTFGRINYVVRGSDRKRYTVLLEELLPAGAPVGP